MTTAVTRGTIRAPQRPGDRIFSTATVVAGSLILAVLAAVAVFLLVQSLPAFVAKPAAFTGGFTNFWTYVWPLAFGTIWSAFLALVIAVPLAIGIALFISHYAPRKLSQGLGYIIDLLAAVPSVVFGLWGIGVLAPLLQPFYTTLVEWFGWIPLFAGPVSGTGRTILTVAIVLAVMVLPIITAICREIFLQTPVLYPSAGPASSRRRC
jgi:phosphate transport system permease protein